MGAQDAWEEVGRLGAEKDAATDKIRAFRRELYGRTYRFIVVRSSSLDARKEHKLEDIIRRKQQALSKDAEQAGKVLYSCQEDASAAA